MKTRIAEVSLVELEARVTALRHKEFEDTTVTEILETEFYSRVRDMFFKTLEESSFAQQNKGVIAAIMKNARIVFTEDTTYVYAELFDDMQDGPWGGVELRIAKKPSYNEAGKKFWRAECPGEKEVEV